MLTDDQHRKIAADMLRAGQDKKPIAQPSKSLADIGIEDGYAIQKHWAGARLKEGAKLVGYKIGLTSRAMQIAANVTHPDYGHLMNDMMFEDGAHIPAGRFLSPKIEVELAFVMGKPLKGPGVTAADVLRATDYITPAMEIADFRTEMPRKIADTIADNSAAAGIVTGGRMIRPFDLDIRWVGATLSQNAVIEDTGVSAAVMGHPATAMAWLCNKLAEHGACLEAGQVILAGSFTRALAVNSGDVFTANFGPLGALAVSFA